MQAGVVMRILVFCWTIVDRRHASFLHGGGRGDVQPFRYLLILTNNTLFINK
jgi:hypothetical protein